MTPSLRLFPNLAGVLGLAVLVFARPRTAVAGGGASTDAYDRIDPHASIDIHGIVDSYEQINVDAPASRTVTLRAFDQPCALPSLGVAGVTVAHAPGVTGFRIDASVGNVANAFLAYDPARRAHPEISRAASYVEQAFVTVVAPLDTPVSIDVGKFDTPVGLEDNVSLTSWNYTRGLLFTLAEPTYHTGARASAQVTDWLATSVFWLNGWNTNLAAGNGMRSFGMAANVDPASDFEVSAVFLAGPERAPTRLDDARLAFREELSTYVTYEVNPRASVAATFDYGRSTGAGNDWWGAGAYARGQLRKWLAVAARGERYADPSGFMTASKGSIDEGTVTLEATIRTGPASATARLEFRRDQSTAHPFAGLSHDDTLALGVTAGF